MTWALRAGRILVVIAVIFFLAATAALARSSSATSPGQDVCRVQSAFRLPTGWVTTPATLLKEVALLRTRIERFGESALVGFGVELLTRSIRWVRHLGLAQVKPPERPAVGGA